MNLSKLWKMQKDRETWRAAVHGAAESQIQISNWTTIGLPRWLSGKESACQYIVGRFLGEGNGNPLQYFCLGNPMDRGTSQAPVHVVARVGHDLATGQQQQWSLNWHSSVASLMKTGGRMELRFKIWEWDMFYPKSLDSMAGVVERIQALIQHLIIILVHWEIMSHRELLTSSGWD